MSFPLSGSGNNVGLDPSQGAGGGAAIGGLDQAGLTMRTQQSDWSQFFGPSKGPVETLPYGAYRRENFALPDAYRGSNLYLTNIIITLVTEQASFSRELAGPPGGRTHSASFPSASFFCLFSKIKK